MADIATSQTDRFREAAMALIEEASTLTLATADPTGPWSAPVYYVFLKGRFYFFSSPHSRHIEQALMSEKAAGSICTQADGWRTIRGIQMDGTITRLRRGPLAISVIARYLARYPFTRDFFKDSPVPDMDTFFSRFKTRLYQFAPTTVFYTDNRFGFATRERIHWNHR